MNTNQKEEHSQQRRLAYLILENLIDSLHGMANKFHNKEINISDINAILDYNLNQLKELTKTDRKENN